jgi:hypothetical protein
VLVTIAYKYRVDHIRDLRQCDAASPRFLAHQPLLGLTGFLGLFQHPSNLPVQSARDLFIGAS